MRVLLLGAMILGLTVAADAAQPKKDDKKIDAAKLVGKWAPIGPKGKPELKLIEEYTADGKCDLTTSKGTYKLEGNTLTAYLENMAVLPRKISKLTDTELVLGFGKTAVTYKKVK